MLTFCFFSWYPGVSFPLVQTCQDTSISLYQMVEGLRWSLLSQQLMQPAYLTLGENGESKSPHQPEQQLSEISWFLLLKAYLHRQTIQQICFSNARCCWLSFLPVLDKASLLIDVILVYLLMVTLKDDGHVNKGNYLYCRRNRTWSLGCQSIH